MLDFAPSSSCLLNGPTKIFRDKLRQSQLGRKSIFHYSHNKTNLRIIFPERNNGVVCYYPRFTRLTPDYRLECRFHLGFSKDLTRFFRGLINWIVYHRSWRCMGRFFALMTVNQQIINQYLKFGHLKYPLYIFFHNGKC